MQYRTSQTLAVDIHPAAKIGKGILLDHGTGVVIGETAVIGNNCSLLQNVTLGGKPQHCSRWCELGMSGSALYASSLTA